MKREIIYLITILSFFSNKDFFAQGGNLGNTRTPTNFLGFNAGPAGP